MSTVTTSTCLAFRGRDSAWQKDARRRLDVVRDIPMSPWAWIRTTCELATCVNTGHMVVHAPRKIHYPVGVCTYCGDLAGTQDHLLPSTWTGTGAFRQAVATVPACGSCNSRIQDAYAFSVTERRAIAHRSIERTYRGLLATPEHTTEEINECGHLLRSSMIAHAAKKAHVRYRLSWPHEPNYDLRAFQKTGIEDPEALGLI